MTLSAALQNSYSGLRATATRAEVSANNIANAETDGFARRDLVLSSSVRNGRGAGVAVVGVQIASAPVLTEDRWRAEAQYGHAEVTTDVADSVARIIGGPDDPGSLFDRYAEFENSLRLLAGDPAASHLQVDVVNKAEDITDQFNEMNDRVNTLRANYDRQIATAVTEINTVLSEIAALNAEIRRDQALGSDTNETASQRNMLIDEIAEYVPLRTIEREDGQITLMTTSGYALVQESAVEFEFTASGTVLSNMDYIAGEANGLSGLTLQGTDVTPPNATTQIFTDGKLMALFEARDVVTVDLQDKIDAMARDLVERFNNTLSPGLEPNLAAGENGLFDFSAGAITDSGLAGVMRVNPLVAADPALVRDGVGGAAGDAGDNTHVTAMIDAFTATQTPPAGAGVNGVHSASNLVAEVTSEVAESAQAASYDVALRKARYDTLKAAETAAIGVDVDFELQELTLIQSAYAANAKVIQAVDEMFDVLLGL